MAKTKKGKQPYIPIYIGDWEQDVNTISLEAEGALLKLIFKLWKSPEKGKIICSPFALRLLLKKDEKATENILFELKNNAILDIKTLENGDFLIQSRRILKEVELSKTRSTVGSKGAEAKKNKAKGKQKVSKRKANNKQSPEYEDEYDNEYEIEDKRKKGGVGERRGKEGEGNLAQRMQDHFLRLPESKHYQWSEDDSRALVGLMQKIRGVLIDQKREEGILGHSPPDEDIFRFWVLLTGNLPEWYRSDGYSLSVWLKKFNELLNSIKSNRNGKHTRSRTPTGAEIEAAIDAI